MRRPDPDSRSMLVRHGDAWPGEPVALGQRLRCPDGRDVELIAVAGLLDDDGSWTQRVVVRGAT